MISIGSDMTNSRNLVVKTTLIPREFSSQHFNCNTSKTPNITFCSDYLLSSYFGSHPKYASFKLNIGLGLLIQTLKICKNDILSPNQNIGSLKISMYLSTLMQIVQSLQKLLQIIFNFFFFKGSLFIYFIFEISTRTEFGNNINVVAVFKRTQTFQNFRVAKFLDYLFLSVILSHYPLDNERCFTFQMSKDYE